MNPIVSLFTSWKESTSPFLFENGKTTSYRDLSEAVDLEAAQISTFPKQAIVLEVENTLASFVRFLALLREGHCVLLCAPYQFHDESYRRFIETETETDFRYCARSETIDQNLSRQSPLRLHSKVAEGMSRDHALFIIRTSGSSGKKYKFVLHDIARFIEKYRRVGAHFAKTLAFSPAESVAGVETLMEVLTHGRVLVAGGDRLTPSSAAKLLKECAIDYLQTTPSFLNLMLLSRQFDREAFKALRKIAYGSEPSQKPTLNAIASQLPDLEFKHTYGMSEIGILHTVTSQTDPSTFFPVQELNPSRIENGMLQIKSITQMLGYLNAIQDITPDGWFCTHDIAQQEGDFIRVLGRADDTINVGGRKFLPSELEDLILQFDNVADVTVFAEDNLLIGKAIVANIVLHKPETLNDFQARFRPFAEKSIPFFMTPHRLTLSNENAMNTRFKKMRRPAKENTSI